jgi:hypothetical protein
MKLTTLMTWAACSGLTILVFIIGMLTFAVLENRDLRRAIADLESEKRETHLQALERVADVVAQRENYRRGMLFFAGQIQGAVVGDDLLAEVNHMEEQVRQAYRASRQIAKDQKSVLRRGKK